MVHEIEVTAKRIGFGYVGQAIVRFTNREGRMIQTKIVKDPRAAVMLVRDYLAGTFDLNNVSFENRGTSLIIKGR